MHYNCENVASDNLRPMEIKSNPLQTSVKIQSSSLVPLIWEQCNKTAVITQLATIKIDQQPFEKVSTMCKTKIRHQY